MYSHILVAYDGSEGAKKALNNGLELAKRMDVKLTALWVGGFKAYYHESVAEVEQEEKSVEAFSAKLKKELKEISHKTGVAVEYAYLQGNPAKLVVEFAAKNNVDLIVMGCSGHSRLWGNDLGHVTDKVSENAKCNVLIARK
jgi:nucleotide-binding universal stress UspA family protein